MPHSFLLPRPSREECHVRDPPIDARLRDAVAAAGEPSHAEDIKAPIRGLVSMGAYRFVGSGGDPVNTLDPLNAKPGIFGGFGR